MGVGGLARPGVTVGHLYLSLFVDEDVVGADVADLGEHWDHILFGAGQSIQQVPNLALLEPLLLAPPVMDLLAQQIRERLEL